MTFGNEADEAMSAKLFARCRDAGITFFDCANIYTNGKAEEILGRLMKTCRDELVITTKVGFTPGAGLNRADLSRAALLREVDASLKRLQTDRIDVYFCHHFDPSTPVDETLCALDALVRAGKIRCAGVSNWTAWRIARAIGRSELLGLAGISAIQPMYNLAKRAAEIETLPMAQAERLGVITYSPLGGGLLTGKYTRGHKDAAGRLSTRETYAKRYAAEQNYEIAERFCALAAAKGVHPVTLAVAWVKAHPAVTAPIIGARSIEQIEPALAAASYELDSEQWNEISALTPPVPHATDRDEERG